MQDPEIQNILTDPIMRQVPSNLCALLESWSQADLYLADSDVTIPVSQVLIDFQENPRAAQEHLKNPGVMQKIQKLVSAGIVQMR